MSYQLGIDLGTTYTAAAVSRNGHVETSSLGDRSDMVPSVLLIREDGSTLVGDAAEYRGASEPERLAREFKRRMGDSTPILVGGSPYSAESLTARLLRWVVDEVSGREGGRPDTIVITHPANWGPYKIDRLSQAVQLADLDEVHLLSEPEAAAIYYLSQERVDAGSVIAVYDLGGGTFDAAVLRKTENGFEFLGKPKGIEHLGGIDFDAAVFGHVQRSLGKALTELDEEDARAQAAVARLRSDCVVAKETLSSDTDVTIPVAIPSVDTEVRLTRAEFESMIQPPLVSSVSALHLAITSAGISADDVTAVLLVGGSSRIPLVGQLVGAELGRPVHVDTHPKNSIARGAALYEATPVLAVESPKVETAPAPVERPRRLPEPPPPTEAPGTPADPADDRRSVTWQKLALPAAIVVAVAAAALGFVLTSGGGSATTEVVFEPLAASGTDPFMPSVDLDPAPPAVTAPAGGAQESFARAAAAVGTDADGAPDVPSVVGTDAGLYAGSVGSSRCDVSAMITSLNDDPTKATAWATAQGITVGGLNASISGLTSAVLQFDTRVIDHRFSGGQANPVRSVLQAGTAVLVDPTGVPRARCASGNPLRPHDTRSAAVTYVGQGWDGFDPDRVVDVTAGASVTELILVELGSGQEFLRPTGTGGEADSLVEPEPEPTPEPRVEATPTSAPTPTTEPTSVPLATVEPDVVVQTGVLLDQGPMTFTTVSEISTLVEEPAGERFSVLLKGSYEVTMTFETGGGSVSGTIEGSMAGISVELETPHSAEFTGTLTGSYQPQRGSFEGTITWAGATTPGVEESIPSDQLWIAHITVPPNDCPGARSPCIFANSDPDTLLIWEIELPADLLNPDR